MRNKKDDPQAYPLDALSKEILERFSNLVRKILGKNPIDLSSSETAALAFVCLLTIDSPSALEFLAMTQRSFDPARSDQERRQNTKGAANVFRLAIMKALIPEGKNRKGRTAKLYDRDKQIWMLHKQGFSFGEISKMRPNDTPSDKVAFSAYKRHARQIEREKQTLSRLNAKLQELESAFVSTVPPATAPPSPTK
jgi:hypothetical protein